MPHEPGHNGNTTSYKVYGTNENYSGLTVEIGGFMYSTVGGALEGNSLQLVAGIGDSEQQPQMGTIEGQTGVNPVISNPVTRTFVSRTVYYRAVSGNGVPIGTTLHQHQDGTIMVGNHNNPNYDMNNPDNVVTTTNPNPSIGSGNGGAGNGGGNSGRNLTGGIGGY